MTLHAAAIAAADTVSLTLKAAAAADT